jgi:endonuclease YncB( thermonuclease family)
MAAISGKQVILTIAAMTTRPSKIRRIDPASRRARPTRKSRAILAAGCLAVFVLTIGVGLAVSTFAERPSGVAPERQAARIVHVIDGDTLALAGGERVRILNIDTAELPPRARCDREVQLAWAAKARLAQLTRAGGEVTLRRAGRDRDRFGRQLRLVAIDGQDVGEQLVREGLAQPWRGRPAQWC